MRYKLCNVHCNAVPLVFVCSSWSCLLRVLQLRFLDAETLQAIGIKQQHEEIILQELSNLGVPMPLPSKGKRIFIQLSMTSCDSKLK
jgi:hypothetical protein